MTNELANVPRIRLIALAAGLGLNAGRDVAVVERLQEMLEAGLDRAGDIIRLVQVSCQHLDHLVPYQAFALVLDRRYSEAEEALASSPPRGPGSTVYALARAALLEQRNGDLDGALRVLRSAVASSPADVRLKCEIVRHLLVKGALTEARRMLEGANEDDRVTPCVCIRTAELLVREGDGNEARALALLSDAADRGDFRSIRQEAYLIRHLSGPREAVMFCEHALAHAPLRPTIAFYLHWLCHETFALVSDWAGVLRHAQAALRIRWWEPGCWSALAIALHELGQSSAASEAARAMLSLDPPAVFREPLRSRGLDEPCDIPEAERETFEVFSARVNTLRAEYGPGYALAVTRGVLRGDPDPAKMLVEARMLLACGDAHEALRVQERLEILAAPLGEHEAARIEQLALTHVTLGRPDVGLRVVRDRPADLRDHGGMLATEAFLLHVVGEEAEAAAAARTAREALASAPQQMLALAVQIAPVAPRETVTDLIDTALVAAHNDALAWQTAALAWRVLDDHAAAAHAYRRVTELDSSNAGAYLAAANSARRAALTDLVEEGLREGVAHHPEDAELLKAWAGILWERGQIAEAEPFARQATVSAPRDSEGWLLYGKILHARDRDDEAADAIVQALWWPPLPDVPPELAHLVVQRFGDS